jgi:hypothetical protein
MATFLNAAQVEVNKAGYLVVVGTTTSVYNEEYLAAQKQAAYVVELAKVVKTKDFVGKKADSLNEAVTETMANLNKANKTDFGLTSTKPSMDFHDKLKAEAMSFISFQKDSTENERVNDYMQRFSVLKNFEEFGLYFEEKIVKLNRIYTLSEVLEAVKQVINLLK